MFSFSVLKTHLIFKKAGAHNVKWMFSPNVLWGDKTFEKDILPYYPGDSLVDMVGLDGYNFGDHKSAHHKWQSYDEVFGASIDDVATPGIWVISEQ